MLWSWLTQVLRVNGTTGDNFAGTGSLYVDSTAGVLYINTGAISNPTWVVVGTQS
jgi:hypothetical protein